MLSLKQAQRMVARQRARFEKALRKYGHTTSPELAAVVAELSRREKAAAEVLARRIKRRVFSLLERPPSTKPQWVTFGDLMGDVLLADLKQRLQVTTGPEPIYHPRAMTYVDGVVTVEQAVTLPGAMEFVAIEGKLDV